MTATGGKLRLNWKQKIVRDLERVETLLPEPACVQGEWPEWTKQMATELAKTTIPKVNCGKLDDLTAMEVGRIVGVKQAAMSEVEEVGMTEKQEEALERLLKDRWGDKAEENFLEHIKLITEKFFPAYERAIRRSINSASKQPPQQQADFFRGYSEMVGERPDARSTTTTKIYFFMILYWREIDALAKSGRYSVRQLHDLLCGIFGAHLVGDRKNIEKMCERKGLHFRGRGRPCLPEKSDIKAA